MSYTFDYFVAAMKCPKCGRVSARDRSTNMQTKLAPEPGMRDVGEGDVIDVPSREEIAESGYREIRASTGPIVLLEPWTCAFCRAANWARVELAEGGRVARIAAVALDRAQLESASFVSDEAIDVASRLAGMRVAHADVVRVLREKL